ncbi:hypothetical protein SprV_0401526100 [Sparganum proliferum]
MGCRYTVSGVSLPAKTSACGSPDWVVSWLDDYFTFRTQFVQSGKWKSTVKYADGVDVGYPLKKTDTSPVSEEWS